MKLKTLIIFVFASKALLASEQKVRFDEKNFLKFNDENWNYLYIKELKTITPHFLESKTNKYLRVIVQKETHLLNNENRNSLIANKCAEANKIYQENKQGSANSIEIKNRKVCFVQLVNQDKMSYQILYPINFGKTSYDLLSFSWKAANELDLPKIKDLVGENL